MGRPVKASELAIRNAALRAVARCAGSALSLTRMAELRPGHYRPSEGQICVHVDASASTVVELDPEARRAVFEWWGVRDRNAHLLFYGRTGGRLAKSKLGAILKGDTARCRSARRSGLVERKKRAQRSDD